MYFIIETQVDADGVGASIVTTTDTRNEAESEYHRILQAAAVSEVAKHGAAVLTDEAVPIMNRCYTHQTSTSETIVS